ncbi:MAG TPA: MG2 domain-containing protein, partial [bacterium]|nr:MG2 domain-containing protein [bacterium]
LDLIRYKSVLENTNELYLSALETLEKAHSSNSMVSMVIYKKALWYSEVAYSSQTEPGVDNDPAKWHLKTSKALCEKVIANHSKTEAANLCAAHISRLTVKNIYLTNESANTPGKPFRMLVNFQNVKKLYFKIAALSDEERKTFQNYSIDMQKGAQILAKKQAVKEWTVDLPDDGDLRNHSTEISIPALDKGIYAVIAGTDKNYSYNNQAIFYSFIDITNLSLISKSENAVTKFFVADRESGTPIEDAQITIYKTKYNYKISRYEYIKVESLETDKNGLAIYKKGWMDNDYYQSQTAVVKKDKDTLSVNFNSGYNQEARAYERTVFFTDRAIYRPGQTIYFKGIMLNIDKDQKPEILSRKSTTVEFYDVNWQKITSLNLKTNEFGSFQGSFTAPSNALNGNMTIRNTSGAAYVSVEEYKRPKFETKFLPVKESFKLDDTVKIKGTATAYSGAPLTEAKVAWRVVRTIYFPYWYWGYNYGFYSNKQTVMGKGIVNTNDLGEYEINFKALPDKSVPKKMLPAFTYTVYADVTDINGETHSTTTFVSVGFVALSLSTDIADDLNSTTAKKIEIISSNLNGEFEPAKGTIKISKLVEPSRLLRKRLWAMPDRFLIGQKDYEVSFPNDIYKNENEQGSWKSGNQVFSAEFDTSKSKSLDISKVSDWKDGYYLVEIDSADKYGTAVKYRKNFKVYKPVNGTMEENSFFKVTVVTPAAEPGTNAQIMVGSKAKEVSVIFEIEKKNKKVETSFYKLNGEKKIISIPISESDRGNIGYSIL